MTDPTARNRSRRDAFWCVMQNNDLAAKNPDELKEMQALFKTEAEKYQVLSLDNSGFVRLLTPQPSLVAGKTAFTFSGENAKNSRGL